MTLEDVNRWRKLAGRAATLCCILFFLSLADGLILHFKQSSNDVWLLPGTSVDVNGPARENIHAIDQLDYASHSGLLRVSFEKVHAGYWLGGRMWRGVLSASEHIVPGEYAVTVISKVEPAEMPMTAFNVKVFGDALSMQRSSNSFLQRHSGISPWLIALPCITVALMLFGVVYLCSQKREKFLGQLGKAEIYRISKTEDGSEISFSLGTKHGVQNGSWLMLLDAEGIALGSVRVVVAYEADSTALAPPDLIVKPGYMVSLERM